MIKFRSWNEDKKVFSYFKNGKYYMNKECNIPNLAEHFDFIPFNWNNAQLVDSREKKLLFCQMRRKRKALLNINIKLEDIRDYKPGYCLIKKTLIESKERKESEIDNIEAVLIDVFHVTENELKEI